MFSVTQLRLMWKKSTTSNNHFFQWFSSRMHHSRWLVCLQQIGVSHTVVTSLASLHSSSFTLQITIRLSFLLQPFSCDMTFELIVFHISLWDAGPSADVEMEKSISLLHNMSWLQRTAAATPPVSPSMTSTQAKMLDDEGEFEWLIGKLPLSDFAPPSLICRETYRNEITCRLLFANGAVANSFFFGWVVAFDATPEHSCR